MKLSGDEEAKELQCLWLPTDGIESSKRISFKLY